MTVCNMFIEGGRALLGQEFQHEFQEASLRTAGREIAAVGPDNGRDSLHIDAAGLLVLPGIVDLHGDAFDRQVWALVAAIPYGQTRTYGQLARELGDPALAQKVGVSNARNRLCIVVPCHRVVGADGKLTGYAGGLDRKRALLELEAPVPAGRLF